MGHIGAAVNAAILAGLLCAGARGMSGDEALHGFLEHEEATRHFSGTVLVAEGDTVRFEYSYGMADFELGVEMTPKLIHRIGSVTKPFTATAVLMLIDSGAIDPGDSICAFLARCPSAWQAVSIRQLLNHTSGIPDLFEAVDCAAVETTRGEIDAVLSGSDAARLQTPPGTRYEYNNFGYLLLGYAMETVTGQSWDRYLDATIFNALGMPDTRYDDVWAIVPRRVEGYEIEGGELRNIHYEDHCAFSAGGLHSTARDLLRWNRALHTGKLLTSESYRLMFEPGPGNYGFGWLITREDGLLRYEHSGGVGGASAHLSYFPDNELTVIVLSNVQEVESRRLALEAFKRFLDHAD